MNKSKHFHSNQLVRKLCIFLAMVGGCNFELTAQEYNNAHKTVPIIQYLLDTDASNVNELVTHRYQKNTGPDKNPLKGWNSGWWNEGRDEASVGFQYIKWKEFEPSKGVYDLDAVEDVINRPGSRNRHVILRLYCDWHGEHEPNDDEPGRSAGCPEWVYTDGDTNITHITGTNGRKLTDYNDPRYIERASTAIAKLAEFYDDDPRIHAIQLGILGYWGEWHTSGSEVDPNEYLANEFTSNYTITDASRSQILASYLSEFSKAKLMARYPWESTFDSTTRVGFHNDYFMPDDGHSSQFDDTISESGQWRNGPIGGEAPPEFREDQEQAVFGSPQGMQMISTGHYTTMLLDKPSDPEHLEQYMALHRKMGYNFQIEKGVFAQRVGHGTAFDISLSITNIGVAPMYQSWRVEYALIDDNGQPVVVREASQYNLASLFPNDTSDLVGQLSTSELQSGQYRVGVRIIQPGAQDNKPEPWALLARNTYVVLSNDIEVLDGVWDGNNALFGGWSILGTTLLE